MRTESKPVIGIVADLNRKPKHPVHSVGDKYLDAVTGGAGAIAFMLPALIDRPGGAFSDPGDIEAVLDRLNGLFLTGATSNVDPARYGAALSNPESPADRERDHVSLALIRGAIARGMPILGVCRGFQEINVALGGTLHQEVHNVPGLNDHRERDEDPLETQYGPAHAISLTQGGLLAGFAGAPQAAVNSLHGQGIDRLAPGLAVEATAPDGLIEAYRGTGPGFLLAVQWHPEWRFRENPLSVKIFEAFGQAARAWRAAQSSAAGLAA